MAQSELKVVMGMYDAQGCDELEQDLITTARQAMQKRGQVDAARAEIVFCEAGGGDATTLKTNLQREELINKALERKVNFLRRELYSRDPKKYSFLKR